MSNVGKINVLIGGNAENFYKAIGGVQKKLNAVSKDMKKVGKSLSMMVTAPLAAIGAAAMVSTVNVGKFADTLLDLEQQAGISTDELQRYRQVTLEAGVATDTVANAAIKLQQRFARGAEGSADLAAGLQMIGVVAKDASGQLRPMDSVMNETLTSLAGMEDATMRNQAAIKIFGDGAKDLIPILALGADGIENAKIKAGELGMVLSGDALQAANEFRIKFDTLKASFSSVSNELGVAFLPIADILVDLLSNKLLPAIRNVIEWFKGLDSTTKTIITVIGGLVAAIGPVILAIGTILPMLPALGTAIAALTGPIGLTVLAVVGLGTVIVTNWDKIKYYTLRTIAVLKASFAEFKFKLLDFASSIAGFFGITSESIEQMKADTLKDIEDLNNALNDIDSEEDARVRAEKKAEVQKKEAIKLKADLSKIEEQQLEDKKARDIRYQEWLKKHAQNVRRIFEQEMDAKNASFDNFFNFGDKMQTAFDSIIASFEGKNVIDFKVQLDEPSLTESEEKLIESADTVAQSWKDKIKSMQEVTDTFASIVTAAFMNITNGIMNSLESFAETGKLSLQNVGIELMKFIKKLAIAAVLAKVVSMALGGILGVAGSFSSLFGQFSGINFASTLGGDTPFNFGGSRASGGNVDFGKAYTVGERGRELFIPNTSGTIVNTEALSGMGSSGGLNEVMFKLRGDDMVALLKSKDKFKQRF